MIYGQRDELLEAESVQENIEGIREDVVADIVARYVPADSIDEQWDLQGLEATIEQEFGVQVPVVQMVQRGARRSTPRPSRSDVQDAVAKHFAEREQQLGPETMRMLEKHIMLNVLDQNWKEHLARMDYLRQGIHLRGYAQKQPKQEYKKEAFELFSDMLEKVKREVVDAAGARAHPQRGRNRRRWKRRSAHSAEAQARQMQFQHADAGGFGADEEAAQVQAAAQQRRLRRTSAATIRARAAAARSTSTATASWPDRTETLPPPRGGRLGAETPSSARGGSGFARCGGRVCR